MKITSKEGKEKRQREQQEAWERGGGGLGDKKRHCGER
jgi:hypothetical protein